MKKSLFETLLSFLLGVSFAFLILGSALTFMYFLDFGLFSALLSTIIFVFFSLFFILILETMNLYVESHDEKRKQTRLLIDIKKLLENNANELSLEKALKEKDN
ncbi:hypothetical protein JHD50_01420 [Sulfurimonas sp. MAG313]|nr:hypothetical protein [Sulfurimonas sp. MAG313]MDF1879968.1 hypothetical protein [Sulfurimonas sp. MAG313]